MRRCYSREYKYDPKETIDPELNRIVQQYMMIKTEGQKLAEMTGMPEEQARNIIAETGMSAEDTIKMMQEQGEQQAEGAEGGREESMG